MYIVTTSIINFHFNTVHTMQYYIQPHVCEHHTLVRSI